MRNRLLLCITTAAFLCIVVSCNDTGTSVNKLELSGTYTYKGYDTSGVLTSTGTLILKRTNSQLTGKLTIGSSNQADSVEGRVVEPDTIELYSNPHQVVLNYILWRGIRNDGSIRGEIFSVRFDPGGQLRIGSFVAIKLSD